MYCPYCHAEIKDNTTVCGNCGYSFAIKTTENKCSHCGYTGELQKISKSLSVLDWIILIGFFPISLIYYFLIKQFKSTKILYKCPRCKHVEEYRQ